MSNNNKVFILTYAFDVVTPQCFWGWVILICSVSRPYKPPVLSINNLKGKHLGKTFKSIVKLRKYNSPWPHKLFGVDGFHTSKRTPDNITCKRYKYLTRELKAICFID